eukprot:Nk52_evm27s2133 gene=Nk52_evmTU27s2133
MHGRAKVKSSAEEAEAKRKEQFKKLAKYQHLVDAVQKMKENGLFNKEALILTEKLLSVNADFYSCWNYRHDILNRLMKDAEEEEEGKGQKMMDEEYRFSESVIRNNPKSYFCWNHRRWLVLKNASSEGVWKRELGLCDAFLDLDSRNFHCWDYRRWVIGHYSERQPKDEFNYTTLKINQNFSNYSAWHYRSGLLPRVEGESIDSELDMVQSACFTEPDDQSAWLYQQWLLSKVGGEGFLSQCVVGRECGEVVCVYSQPAGKPSPGMVRVYADEEEAEGGGSEEGCWRTPHDEVKARNGARSVCWIFKSALGRAAKVKIEGKIFRDVATFSASVDDIGEDTKALLAELLDSCEQLVDLEPDSRWALFNSVLLMGLDKGRKWDRAEMVDSLIEVDPKRRGFYRDLKSKLVIDGMVFEGKTSVSLAEKCLTTMHYGERMVACRSLDLSGNLLGGLSGRNFNCFLLFLETLVLDDNAVECLSDLCLGRLRSLRVLSVRNNQIRSCVSCVNQTLEDINLSGNPLTNYRDALLEIFPNLKSIK